MVERAVDELRARLRVHVDGPLLVDNPAARKVALVEAARLVAVTLGTIAPLDALAIARGELYALLVSSRHWRWAKGQTSDVAMIAGAEAFSRARQGPSVEPVPTRAGLDALLIAIAHQIQDEVAVGEGTDADVDRVARLWRYALQPYVSRERLGSEARSAGDEFVHDLVELAFRELGHARITAPPFGGRPDAEWIKELKRRREGVLRMMR